MSMAITVSCRREDAVPDSDSPVAGCSAGAGTITSDDALKLARDRVIEHRHASLNARHETDGTSERGQDDSE